VCVCVCVCVFVCKSYHSYHTSHKYAHTYAHMRTHTVFLPMLRACHRCLIYSLMLDISSYKMSNTARTSCIETPFSEHNEQCRILSEFGNQHTHTYIHTHARAHTHTRNTHTHTHAHTHNTRVCVHVNVYVYVSHLLCVRSHIDANSSILCDKSMKNGL